MVNKNRLVKEIVERADGIFLWVALVLKSLRDGLQYDNRLSSLLQRVKDMPMGVEPVIQHLLNSIDPLDCKAAYRTFAVVQKLRDSDCLDMSLFRYTFLEDHEANPNFTIEPDFRDSGADEVDIASRMEGALARLNGQFKGLLEVRSDHNLWRGDFCPQSITFTHRSVYDFIV